MNLDSSRINAEQYARSIVDDLCVDVEWCDWQGITSINECIDELARAYRKNEEVEYAEENLKKEIEDCFKSIFEEE